jgi:hypothetical protein
MHGRDRQQKAERSLTQPYNRHVAAVPACARAPYNEVPIHRLSGATLPLFS